MRTDDFDFNLPEELIAQTPILNRSESKLLVLDKETGNITHERFYNIINYLDSNDILVLNNTKVIPARIYGVKEATGAKIELLILKNIEGDIFQCLVKPARRIHVGDIVSFNEGLLRAECIELHEEGIIDFKFLYDGVLLEILDKIGSMPLPPYIREKLNDKDRYQTVYAKNHGSAAAPTAGLHFTPELLEAIKAKGITVCYVTLHIGLGTFRPVSVEDVTKHTMHSEEYYISSETANILNEGIKNGKRIVAVGTTSTRTLESAFDNITNSFKECHDNTSIFIYPGYKFKVVGAQITNFHLPKSTLVMLVSAFASKEKILNAYEEAIENKYRFFSFGDSMFIK